MKDVLKEVSEDIISLFEEHEAEITKTFEDSDGAGLRMALTVKIQEGEMAGEIEAETKIKFVTDTVEDSRISTINENQSELNLGDRNPEEQTAPEKPEPSPAPVSEGSLTDPDQVKAAIAVIKQTGKASISLFQRELKIGYSRASLIMAALEEENVVGPHRGSAPREISIATETGKE